MGRCKRPNHGQMTLTSTAVVPTTTSVVTKLDPEADLRLTQLQLQNEKLQLEIKASKKSIFSNPATVCSVVVALVAVGGLWIQRSQHQHNLKVANEQNDDKLRAAQIARDTAELQKLKVEQETSTMMEKHIMDLAAAKEKHEQIAKENSRLAKENELASARLIAISAEYESKTKQLTALNLGSSETKVSVPEGKTVEISGRVDAPDGSPIQSVDVSAYKLGCPRPIASVKSDRDGKYSITFPSSNTGFDLAFSHPQYEVSILPGLSGNNDHRLNKTLSMPGARMTESHLDRLSGK